MSSEGEGFALVRTDELTDLQIKAVRMLALGRSNRWTANRIGVTETAIRKWRKIPAFADYLEEQLAEGRERAERHLRGAEARLVSHAIDIATGKKKADMVRWLALRDCMTRLGVGKPERLEVSGGLDEMSDEDLERAALARAAERGWSPPEDEEADEEGESDE